MWQNIPIDTSESISCIIVLVAVEALAVNQERASFVCANAVSGRHQSKDGVEGCGASPGPSQTISKPPPISKSSASADRFSINCL